MSNCKCPIVRIIVSLSRQAVLLTYDISWDMRTMSVTHLLYGRIVGQRRLVKSSTLKYTLGWQGLKV